MLEIVTLTGVDEQTNLTALMELADEFPAAEFASLAGSRTGRDDPEYPGKPTLRLLGRMGERGARTALHLCGRMARAVAVEKEVPGDILELCDGFGRVQVNLDAEWFDGERGERTRHGIIGLAEAVAAEKVILQHRGDWESIPIEHPKVDYLFDPSGGRGVDSLHVWPPPPEGRAVGYAGGIGLDNIGEALEFTGRYPDARLWLDMQRKLRNEQNRFDMSRARRICVATFRDAPLDAGLARQPRD